MSASHNRGNLANVRRPLQVLSERDDLVVSNFGRANAGSTTLCPEGNLNQVPCQVLSSDVLEVKVHAQL